MCTFRALAKKKDFSQILQDNNNIFIIKDRLSNRQTDKQTRQLGTAFMDAFNVHFQSIGEEDNF